MRQREERIAFRVIGRATASRNVVRHDDHPADAARVVCVDSSRDSHNISSGKPQSDNIVLIHEDDFPRPPYAPKTIAIAVDCCVELVVRAQRRKMKKLAVIRRRKLRK